ncbi:flagellar filament capping protein FliD [Clostridium cochlearium]|uniref:flagellar filament capping protein FliD n=1 Tax=Clostridium cochlearium TaxID=1494 RepID=UPI0022E2B466|nr:flagellar filament capping protein FliD [Clostridium cochlearium]
MVNGIGGYGGIRMGGLATGLETDDIIKKMLAGQQTKIDKTKQERQQIQWKQEMYRDIIKDVKDLQNTYFDIMSKDNLASEKAFYDYDSKILNGTSVAITGGQGALEGNYKINVKQLATAATIQSKQFNDKVNLNSKLLDLGISGEKEIKISSKLGEKTSLQTIKIDENDTMKTMIDKVRKEMGDKVEVSYSELTRRLSFKTKETGMNTEIKVEGLVELGIDGSISATGINSVVEITPPGIDENIQVIKETNNFIIDGINYKLQEKGETTASITKDADKTFDRFKEFIDKYNSLVGNIKGKLTEKKAYSYKPLTEEQKKEMKEDDIKKWEEKAKQGILRNDPNLEKMLRELRGTFFASVDGAGESFGRHIGLDTTNDYKTAGQIKFTEGGEEKFKKALLERPEDIMNLFTKKPDKNFLKEIENNKSLSQAEKDKKIYDNSGIFTRMDNILRNYVGAPGTTLNNSILTKYANKQEDHSTTGAIGANNLPDQIYRKDNLIKELDKKLREREERLYKQFATLEKAMTKYNAQAGWLSQQFGGGM